jgi:hypothetical protein
MNENTDGSQPRRSLDAGHKEVEHGPISGEGK